MLGSADPFTSAGAAYQQRESAPPPETVDLRQSGLAHPLQLVFNQDESVFGVVIRSANQIQELAMEFRRGRGNNLKVGK